MRRNASGGDGGTPQAVRVPRSLWLLVPLVALARLHGPLRPGSSIRFLRATDVVGLRDAALRVTSDVPRIPAREISSRFAARFLVDVFFFAVFLAAVFLLAVFASKILSAFTIGLGASDREGA
jgi:hypothetical protein